MKIEVLVAAMFQNDTSLYQKMNLQTDAIIINQSDENDVQLHKINNNIVKLFSYTQRGVGRSRNSALLNANADICLLADEDMVYVDGYDKIVEEAFNKYPKADVIFFDVDGNDVDRPIDWIRKEGRMSIIDANKFGAPKIAFRLKKIQEKNIWFSILFGGGAKYGSGEDSIFISDLFKKHLKVYGCKKKIASFDRSTSSWFDGYNEKYYFDKGALYGHIWGVMARFVAILSSYRIYKRSGKKDSYFEILSCMQKGVSKMIE